MLLGSLEVGTSGVVDDGLDTLLQRKIIFLLARQMNLAFTSNCPSLLNTKPIPILVWTYKHQLTQ